MAMKACDRCWPVGDGPGYMAMCPCDGSTDVDHGEGRRPWRGTLAVVGGGDVGNHGGVAGGVATVVSTIVTILAATTAVAAVVVPMPVVVAAVTIHGAAAVVLARQVRR
jgi:hypothetical protein